jgi:aquaporin Z
MKKLLMEFLGTFFLVLTIAMTGNPFAIAAMLMAWVYIGGYISGGHYNPAVSLAVAARGRLAWHELPWYWLAQVLGGIAAYLLTAHLRGAISIPMPGHNVTLGQAFIMEILLAFVLALVVLVVATSERLKIGHIFGFAIGFTIPALAYLGGPISGGLFNPAIALGANIVGALKGMTISWEHLFMYVIGALVGGLLAACAYKYFLKENNEEIIIFKFINW